MKITFYEHPLAVVAPQVFEADSLAVWLLNRFGEAPSVTVQIFKGEPSAETEITGDIEAILANDCAEYVVLQSPGGTGMEILMWAMLAAAVVMVVLIPSPVMPGNVNRTQQSPNNSLANRENKVRMLERVEDIFGTVKSIPSMMMPTYSKYQSHKKYETGYYCVGRGYYGLAELRDGDTLISDIPGASAAVYHPFTSPNGGSPVLQIGTATADAIVTATRATEVDGLTLKALNQVQPQSPADYIFDSSGGFNRIRQKRAGAAGDGAVLSKPNFSSTCAIGDTLFVLMDSFVLEVGAWHDAAHAVVAEIGADHWHVISSTSHNYSGNYVVTGVSDGEVILAESNWVTAITPNCTVSVRGVSEFLLSAYTAWTTLPSADRTEVWCNIVAPNGMFKDSGGKSPTTASYIIEIEKLDPSTLLPLATPVVETVTGRLTGATSDERAETVEHLTAWTGPARVRMARTSQYDYNFSGTVQDEIKWADLYSVSPVSKAEFGNKTTIHTVTRATTRATAVKSRQLNCIASRLLPSYNGSTFSGAFDATGLHVSGTIVPTSKLVDIIAAVSVDPKIGARTLATEVDMAQIWAVQQQLDAWNAACGQFNYTLDSDNTSFEETLILIANAGFSIAYRQNGKIRLALDQAQTASTALFTHRNKKPNSETITRRFASNSDYDGVELSYMDPDSHQSETISLPLDGSATKIKKYEIAGIRSFTQAWLRANREYKKLIGQRIVLETTTTLDARSLLPNARIDVVDNTRFKSYDGEVVAQSGFELTLSQPVAFLPATAHSLVLMRRDGSLQSIPVTAGSAANKVILQSLPSEAITTQYGEAGIRTIYSFAADSARAAMAYLVQEIDISDGQYVGLKAINYSADYYAGDYAAIPAKATIIN